MGVLTKYTIKMYDTTEQHVLQAVLSRQFFPWQQAGVYLLGYIFHRAVAPAVAQFFGHPTIVGFLRGHYPVGGGDVVGRLDDALIGTLLLLVRNILPRQVRRVVVGEAEAPVYLVAGTGDEFDFFLAKVGVHKEVLCGG
jgi:hypothetical protein